MDMYQKSGEDGQEEKREEERLFDSSKNCGFAG